MASSCSPARRITPLSRTTVPANSAQASPWGCSFWSRASSVSTSANPRIAEIGVRSSWPMAAKNCSWLARAWSPSAMASASERFACSADIREVRAALRSRRSATRYSGQGPGEPLTTEILPNIVPSTSWVLPGPHGRRARQLAAILVGLGGQRLGIRDGGDAVPE